MIGEKLPQQRKYRFVRQQHLPGRFDPAQRDLRDTLNRVNRKVERVEARLRPLEIIRSNTVVLKLLAGVVGFGAATGRFPRLFLIVCLLFVAAAVGLIRLYRWGWALTTAASFLLMSYGVWAYLHTHMVAALVMISNRPRS